MTTGLSVARATSRKTFDHAGAAVPRGERAMIWSMLGVADHGGDYLVIRCERIVVAVGGGVDRVRDRRVRDDELAQLAGGICGEFRQFKPVLDAAVGEQHARAARQRDDADAVAFGRAPRAKDFHHVDEVVHVAHFDEAAVAERGLEQFVARGHARRMRGRSLAADVGVADFPYEYRLAELEARVRRAQSGGARR